MKVLVVIDMQNDFITGALAAENAEKIIKPIIDKMKGFDGMILATKDTHKEDYLHTQEGRMLPLAHCIKGTNGWKMVYEIERLLTTPAIEKNTFGSVELAQLLSSYNKIKPLTEVTLVGLCTDICVISNALLIKAFLPETPIKVDAECCAGSTAENHRKALEAMQRCQIIIENQRPEENI